jgi:hypothetical protein
VREDRVVIAGGSRRQDGVPLDVEDAHVDAARRRVTPAQLA